MSVQEQLQAIQERANRMTVPDPTGMRIAPDTYLTDADRRAGDFDPIAHIVADLSHLVAALGGVLDFTVADNTPIWVGIALDEIITEALGGGA